MPNSNEIEANRKAYQAALELQGYGLADADVAAMNTRALIRSTIAGSANLTSLPVDRARQLADIFDYLLENGITTIATIAALTTVAGLLSIFTTYDSTLPAVGDFKYELPMAMMPQPYQF